MFSIERADPELRPVRWFLQTPERHAAGRPARAAPSIVAALSALRNNLGAGSGQKLAHRQRVMNLDTPYPKRSKR